MSGGFVLSGPGADSGLGSCDRARTRHSWNVWIQATDHAGLRSTDRSGCNGSADARLRSAGPRASARLLTAALRDKRKIDATRLDRRRFRTSCVSLERRPKLMPRNIALPRELRVALWIDYLQRVRTGALSDFEEALEQLGPDFPDEEGHALVERH